MTLTLFYLISPLHLESFPLDPVLEEQVQYSQYSSHSLNKAIFNGHQDHQNVL